MSTGRGPSRHTFFSKLREELRLHKIIAGVVITIVGAVALSAFAPLEEWIAPLFPGDSSSTSSSQSGRSPSPVATSTTQPTSSTDIAMSTTTVNIPRTTSRSPTVTTNRPTTTVASVRAVDLTSLELVSQGSDVDIDKTLQLGGTPRPHSISYSCNTFCNEPVGSVTFALNGKVQKVTMLVGVNDNAEDTSYQAVFSAYVDNAKIKDWVVSWKHPKPVTVVIPEGGLQLRLEAARVGTEDNPAMAGANSAWGVSNGLPDLVWGSPTAYILD